MDTDAETTSAGALEEQKRRAIAHHSDAAAEFQDSDNLFPK